MRIKYLISDGFLNIVFASTINKIISLCSGIIIVRILSKTEYGIYSYVLNIVNIALLLNGLGTLTGIRQYGCENIYDPIKQKSIIRFGLKLGLLFNLFISFFIILNALFIPQSINNTSNYILLASFIPVIAYITEAIGNLLIVDEKNRQYSIYSLLNSFISFSFILIGSYLYSINGAIMFRYLGDMISVTLAIFLFRNIKNIFSGIYEKPSAYMRRDFIKFSFTSCANNSIAHLFYNADIFVIGIMIADPNVIASYKVATTIPLALTFLSSSVMIYVYPKFVKNRANYYWLKKNYSILLISLTVINGLISISFYILAPFIIGIIFGRQYVSISTISFRVLMIGFFFSATLRVPSGNILDMLHLIKPNLYISIVCGIINIVLNVVLIKEFGCIGAAFATTLTYLLYGILSNLILILYIIKIKPKTEIARKIR
ncbi:MAG: polysaccharide biosynthesis C-terminal domain-containing protein [Rectinema sp.]